jgi:hypothetical protein
VRGIAIDALLRAIEHAGMPPRERGVDSHLGPLS